MQTWIILCSTCRTIPPTHCAFPIRLRVCVVKVRASDLGERRIPPEGLSSTGAPAGSAGSGLGRKTKTHLQGRLGGGERVALESEPEDNLGHGEPGARRASGTHLHTSQNSALPRKAVGSGQLPR